MTKKKAHADLDPAMAKIRVLFEKSGMSLGAFGVAMGYDEAIARQTTFQFLKTADPHISTIRKAAQALGVDLCSLLK